MLSRPPGMLAAAWAIGSTLRWAGVRWGASRAVPETATVPAATAPTHEPRQRRTAERRGRLGPPRPR